jgi:hypothetical protein
MAKAMKCDRCGAYYDHYNGKDPYYSNSLKLMHRNTDCIHSTGRSRIDLCIPCMESFVKRLLQGDKS